MPELPEVETARRVASGVLAGRAIVSVAVAADPIVFCGPGRAAVARRLRHRRVRGVARWGKYFWLELDRGARPVFHLGMTGNVFALGEGEGRPRFWKLILTAEGGGRLAYTNARRFGRVRFVDDPMGEPPVSRLGFDVLHGMPSASAVMGGLGRRSGPIKGVLLDQSFAAGVGNWIADEVLYRIGVSPHRPANRLSAAEVGAMMEALEAVVAQAVEVGAESARFPAAWLFHRRWGKRAESVDARGRRVVHETIAGRTAAWVPEHQR